MKLAFVLLFWALLWSTSGFSVTANKVWRIPSGGSVGSWGPINLADGTNAITGVLASKANLPAVGQQLSSSSGSFSTTSGTYVNVTNLSATITVTGRPVEIRFIPDGSGTGEFRVDTSTFAPRGNLQVLRDGVSIGITEMWLNNASTATDVGGYALPPGAFNITDPAPSAGSHTYVLQAQRTNANTTVSVANVKMLVFED